MKPQTAFSPDIEIGLISSPVLSRGHDRDGGSWLVRRYLSQVNSLLSSWNLLLSKVRI
jgi:hypothetical protein